MRRISAAILALLTTAGGAFAADPNTPGRATQPAPRFTLLVRSRAPESIGLLSIGATGLAKPSEIVYLDSAGVRRTKPLADIVALAPPSWAPTPEVADPRSDEADTSDLPIRRLDLTDGQRFVGVPTLRPGTSDASKLPDDTVFFGHEKLGTLAFPLDRVARYWASVRSAPSTGARPFSGVSDSVLLVNGDRLEGLVTKLGLEVVVEVTPVGGAKPGVRQPATRIDCANVEMVNLVNPGSPMRSLRVDLTDGTVLAADSLAGDAQSGKLTFHAPAAGHDANPVTMELSQLAGVVPDPSMIVPLGSLPMGEQRPESGRLGASLARTLPDADSPLGAPDILLPGPMSVEWTIPAGIGSMLGYAQMDDRSFAWGDCVVIITVASAQSGGAERELVRGRLNASSPSLIISTELGALKPGDRLRVRTEAGERGPIQDRVVLRRTLLLVTPRTR
jgi:hypothetical protein